MIVVRRDGKTIWNKKWAEAYQHHRSYSIGKTAASSEDDVRIDEKWCWCATGSDESFQHSDAPSSIRSPERSAVTTIMMRDFLPTALSNTEGSRCLDLRSSIQADSVLVWYNLTDVTAAAHSGYNCGNGGIWRCSERSSENESAASERERESETRASHRESHQHFLLLILSKKFLFPFSREIQEQAFYMSEKPVWVNTSLSAKSAPLYSPHILIYRKRLLRRGEGIEERFLFLYLCTFLTIKLFWRL